MVEAVKHLFCHELFTSLQFSYGELDAGDLPVEPGLFLRQPAQVTREGFDPVGLTIDHIDDRRDAEPQFAKQQDSLQAGERILVVIAVAVRTDPRRRQQADVAVVAKRSGCRASQPGDVLNGPFHVAPSFQSPTLEVDATSMSNALDQRSGGCSAPYSTNGCCIFSKRDIS